MNKLVVKRFFRYQNILIFGLGLLFLLLSLVSPTDPDLGFHIRVGERAWQSRSLPHSNWFNYSFPEDQWVAHELISEVIIYLIYSISGFLGLSIAFSFIMILISWLLAFKLKPPSSPWFIHIPLALLVLVSFNFHMGVRLQVLSWLGLIIIYLSYLAWKQEKPWPVWLWTIICLVWANLHNSLIFAVGVFLLIFILTAIFHQLPKSRYWLNVGVIGAVASLIQPMGWRVYLEFWRTITDNYKVNISEWVPTNIGHTQGLILIISTIIFFLILAFLDQRQFFTQDFVLLILFIFFFFVGLANIRNVPLTMIALLPVFSAALSTLIGQLNFIDHNPPLKVASILSAAILLVITPLSLLSRYNIATNYAVMSKAGDYPHQAVQYLKKHGLPRGRVLNSYNWGGYLIYNFPQAEWFIDGRLAHLRVKNPLDKKEHITALKAYNQLTRQQNDPQFLLDYYQISWTFLARNEPINFYLKKAGWQVLYQDDQVVVYQKQPVK